VDEISQREKRQVMRDTFLSRQANTVDDAGGRYARITPSKVTGATPSPIPRQPATSPWSKSFDEVVGKEPELGFAVDTQEPVGESAEIERSLSQLGAVDATPSYIAPSDRGSQPVTAVAPSGSVTSEPLSTPEARTDGIPLCQNGERSVDGGSSSQGGFENAGRKRKRPRLLRLLSLLSGPRAFAARPWNQWQAKMDDDLVFNLEQLGRSISVFSMLSCVARIAQKRSATMRPNSFSTNGGTQQEGREIDEEFIRQRRRAARQ
jgi:hypothetical protein